MMCSVILGAVRLLVHRCTQFYGEVFSFKNLYFIPLQRCIECHSCIAWFQSQWMESNHCPPAALSIVL